VTAPLLSVKGLTKRFPVKVGWRASAFVSAVDDVSFDVAPGESLGIVGESGCGKSTTARLVLGLIEPDAGDVIFEDQDVRRLAGKDRKAFRRHMQMVFQDPFAALNPRMSIGENIGFPLMVHGVGPDDRRQRTAELLEQVGLHRHHASYFPHQLSGGQLQRVNIARALALSPRLVVCDEPVSALDKSIQAQVLNLLQDLQEQLGLTYVFISHDLNVVEYVSDWVLVMYLGQVVEFCRSDELYQQPLHPYTQVLLASIPVIDPDERRPAKPLSGEIPSPLNPPSGCRFRTRCPFAMEICATERPALRHPTPDHAVACHLIDPDVQ
jgi:oligopeptide/dipeptide ABC transporter ATP-binding protein